MEVERVQFRLLIQIPMISVLELFKKEEDNGGYICSTEEPIENAKLVD